jgi:hypothetical protein
MTELYTFPSTVSGLVHAMDLTRSLRMCGFRTRLAKRAFSHGYTEVITVAAMPPKRPNRKERGCFITQS